jgi:hypothetical protein
VAGVLAAEEARGTTGRENRLMKANVVTLLAAT